MEQSNERNYDNTGAGDDTRLKYLNIEQVEDATDPKVKLCKIRIGKKPGGVLVGSFSGFLDNVLAPVWKDPIGDIPGRFEYGIILTAKDSADGQVRGHCLTLSSHWSSPIAFDILNQLAGAMAQPEWQANPNARKVRISVYSTQNKAKTRYVSRAVCYLAVPNGPKLPTKFPWVEEGETGHFAGVPQPEMMSSGKLDYTPVSDFWLNEAKLLSAIFGNVQAGSVPPPTAGVAQQATTAAAPPAQPAAPKPLAERVALYVTGIWEKADRATDLTYQQVIQKGFALMAKHYSPTNADRKATADLLFKYGLDKKIYAEHVYEKIDLEGTLVPLDLPF